MNVGKCVLRRYNHTFHIGFINFQTFLLLGNDNLKKVLMPIFEENMGTLYIFHK